MTDYRTKKVPVEEITQHDECQHRASGSPEAVTDYARLYEAGGMDALPPIEVWDVEEIGLVVVDGFHRLNAAVQAGLGFVRVKVSGRGDLHEAAWRALAANRDHGVRRTNEDKRKAVWAAIENPIGREQSNGVIADQCGVSRDFVSRIRNQWEAEQLSSDDSSPPPTPPSTRVGRDGKRRPARRQQLSSDDSSDGGVDARQVSSDDSSTPKPAAGSPSDDRPASLLPEWAPRLEEQARSIGATRRHVLAVVQPIDNALSQRVEASLKDAERALKMAAPTPCPWCAEAGHAGCSACRHRGWVDSATAAGAKQTSKKLGRQVTQRA